MNGLMLHCGAKRATLDEVSAVETPVPYAPTGHTPVPHTWVRDLAVDTIRRAYGLDIVEEAHGLGHEGRSYFGLARLGAESGDESWEIVVGWRNGHGIRDTLTGQLRHAMSASFVAGDRVFICDNLAFSGQIRVAVTHWSNVREKLEVAIDDAVPSLRLHQEVQRQRVEVYQSSDISDAHAHDFTVRAMRAGVIVPSQVAKVADEWHAPSFEHGPKTAWRLRNAFTESFKRYSADGQQPRAVKLTRLLDDEISFQDRLRLDAPANQNRLTTDAVVDAELVVNN